MTNTNLAHRRLQNLRLSEPTFETPEAVVGWLTAVQSQDYGPAKWAVAARITGITEKAMDQAFADGSILRTDILRPTWHFVLPSDIRWLLDLTAPRVHALNAYYYYLQAELNDEVLKAGHAVLTGALQGGNRLTRKEVVALLEGAGIPAGGLRLAYILMHAELNGLICSGPLRGKQHTYALLEERAPQATRLTQDEALAELTRRYFTSHGPATVKDFQWWSSLTIANINKGLEMARSHLEHEVIEGVSYWSAGAAPHQQPASPTIHLLQGYDEYIVGYSESKYALDASGSARAQPQTVGLFNHVIILDSQVVGHWKRTITRSAVHIEAAIYSPLSDAASVALQDAADKHGAFLGLPATVTTRML